MLKIHIDTNQFDLFIKHSTTKLVALKKWKYIIEMYQELRV